MFQRPVVQMTKSSVEEEKLKPFIVMPLLSLHSVSGGNAFLVSILLM